MDPIIVDLQRKGFDGLIADLQSTGKEFAALDVAIELANKRLSELPKGSAEFKKIEAEVKAIEAAMKAAATSTGKLSTELTKTTNELSQIKQAMNAAEAASGKNTETFKNLEAQYEATRKKGEEIKNTLKGIRAELSDTHGIDIAVRGISTLVSGYGILQSVQVLLGKENKGLQESLIKLNAIMLIGNSIQQISVEINKSDSIFTIAATLAKRAYAAATAFAAEASVALRVAIGGFLTLGIAGIVLGIAGAWKIFSDSVRGTTESYDEYIKRQEKSKEFDDAKLDYFEKELRVRQQLKLITDEQAQLELLDKLKKRQAEAKLEQQKQFKNAKDLEDIFKAQQSRENDQLTLDEAVKVSQKQRTVTTKEYTDALAKNKKANDAFYDSTLALGKAERDLQKIREDAEKKEKVKPGKIEKVKPGKIEKVAFQTALSLLKKELRATEDQIEDLIAKITLSGSGGDIEKNSILVKLKKQAQDLSAQIGLIESNIIKFNDTLKSISDKDKIQGVGFKIVTPTKEDIKEAKKNLENALDDIDKIKTGKPKETERSPLAKLFGITEEQAEEAMQIVNSISEAMRASTEIASGVIALRANIELDELKKKRDKGLISEKEYEKKSAKIKNEAAEKQRKVDIATAAAKIPLIILGALSSAPFPFNLVLAAIAGALAAAQLAILVRTPLPKFKEGGSVAEKLGLIEGKPHSQGGVPIEVEGKEYVMPTEPTKKHLPALEAMRKGTFDKLFIPTNLIRPDIFSRITNPSTIQNPIRSNISDNTAIESKLKVIADELWYLRYETKLGNKDRRSGTDKVVSNLTKKQSGYQ